MENTNCTHKWVTPITAQEKKAMRIFTAELGISYADVGRACIKAFKDADWDPSKISWIASDKE